MDAELLGRESDGQLVERVLGQRDATALQAIVHRNGAMVYLVCWRVLQHTQDTEDAFQATFLVLAQKLRTIRKHASLASWLHGVAYRVSTKAKLQANARRRRESRASLSVMVPPDDVTWKELRANLDAELGRLPDKWRLPLDLVLTLVAVWGGPLGVVESKAGKGINGQFDLPFGIKHVAVVHDDAFLQQDLDLESSLCKAFGGGNQNWDMSQF
jgi:DNA-directed RNA polymerase specialized sigma24 family protein